MTCPLRCRIARHAEQRAETSRGLAHHSLGHRHRITALVFRGCCFDLKAAPKGKGSGAGDLAMPKGSHDMLPPRAKVSSFREKPCTEGLAPGAVSGVHWGSRKAPPADKGAPCPVRPVVNNFKCYARFATFLLKVPSRGGLHRRRTVCRTRRVHERVSEQDRAERPGPGPRRRDGGSGGGGGAGPPSAGERAAMPGAQAASTCRGAGQQCVLVRSFAIGLSPSHGLR